MDDAWLSVQEAADACGVTYRTIYRMVRRRELPAEKDEGRPYRLRRVDVDAFIERSKVGPPVLHMGKTEARALAAAPGGTWPSS